MKASSTPRVLLIPQSESSDVQGAVRLSSAYYLKPDDWQRDVLEAWLSCDASGKWAAKRCGLLMPRQNGKNVALHIRELFGAVVLGEKILHTAHVQTTSRKSFDTILQVLESPDLAPMVKSTRMMIGRESVNFTNGGSIEYLSRSRGNARGYTVDVLICDEAQELTDEQLEALMPAISSAPLRNPQIIFTGTPPNENAYGDVFGRMRQTAIEGTSSDLSWHEWSVDDVPENLADVDIWKSTNPALGIRLMESVVMSELEQMSAEGFARERLGWWPYTVDKTAIPMNRWKECRVDVAPSSDARAYGVKFSSNSSTVSLAVAVNHDERTYVELVENIGTEKGLTWLVEWLVKRRSATSSIVIDGQQGAPLLAERLKAAGLTGKGIVTVARAFDASASASMFLDMVNEKRVEHIEQEQLDDAVRMSKRRPIGSNGGWGFASIDGSDISPLEAAAFACWASQTAKRNPSHKMRLL